MKLNKILLVIKLTRQNQIIFMSGKTKEKLNIRFKFDDTISEKRGDEILFRVFDILLSSQKEKKRFKEVKKNNENNRGSNSPDKA